MCQSRYEGNTFDEWGKRNKSITYYLLMYRPNNLGVETRVIILVRVAIATLVPFLTEI